MIALIDGDILLYSIGFASEERYYKAEDGYKNKFAKNIKEYCEDRELTYEQCIEPVADSVWKSTFNNTIESILDRLGTDEYLLILSGGSNFRLKIDPEYKANRKDVAKPLHYNELKQYMLRTRKCIVTDGIEADDELGILHMEPNTDTVLCSLDKDLMMIPGRHFVWSKVGPEANVAVTQHEADRAFWKQLLTGDPIDNIKGLHRVGPKASETMLKEAWSNADCLKVCESAYRRVDRLDDMYKNADLLWIQRSRGSTWKELI